MTKEKKELPSFEKAYARLEQILEQLNSGHVALDSSLTLYEEADQLIRMCNKQLVDAERKIAKLVKTREGNLQVDEAGNPEHEPFEEHVLE